MTRKFTVSSHVEPNETYRGLAQFEHPAVSRCSSAEGSPSTFEQKEAAIRNRIMVIGLASQLERA